MSDPSPRHPVVPGPVNGPDSGALPTGTNGGRPTAPGGPVAVILAAGVIAGLAAWLGGEACRDLIKGRRHAVNSRGIILNVVSPRDQDIADARNAGLAFAWLGAVLGAILGAAGGLARRSGRAAMAAAGVGLVAGAVACAAVSMAVLPLYRRLPARSSGRGLEGPPLPHARPRGHLVGRGGRRAARRSASDGASGASGRGPPSADSWGPSSPPRPMS